MSNAVRNQEPKALWNNFADLNAVPRASKKEERVIEFAKSFGEALGLPTVVDHIGNVIIKKPATPGMEDRKIVVLQSHLDMVHQKNNDTVFDFATEGIKMIVDGDWIKADGTTLGADNGIGVASIMTLLASTDIPHPPLEALFTIDEETGMTGALELKGGFLDADIMLKGLGNANKLMNRLLTEISNGCTLSIHTIDGGGLRNAIPRESVATVSVASDQAAAIESIVRTIGGEMIDEHTSTDPNMEVVLEPMDTPEDRIGTDFARNLLRAVYACPSGIYRLSPDIDDLVQTSNNLARVLAKDGEYKILCLTRSSVDTEKMDLAQAIKSTFELVGASVSYSGDYPGWTPKPNAGIVHLMKGLYKEMYKEDAHVYACHAGLECGILGTNYPSMEMISFGPNIRGAHSPDERVQISSVQKYWGFLLETLKRIPKKD